MSRFQAVPLSSYHIHVSQQAGWISYHVVSATVMKRLNPRLMYEINSPHEWTNRKQSFDISGMTRTEAREKMLKLIRLVILHF